MEPSYTEFGHPIHEKWLVEVRKNPPAGVTVGRRGARGGKVEVTELDPQWLKMLPTCSLSITEASPGLG